MPSIWHSSSSAFWDFSNNSSQGSHWDLPRNSSKSFWILPGILSDISPGICADILTGIPSEIPPGVHFEIHLEITTGIYIGVFSEILLVPFGMSSAVFLRFPQGIPREMFSLKELLEETQKGLQEESLKKLYKEFFEELL